jgi:hypothetical protein
VGYFALGQEGICGDILVLNVNGIEQWNGHLDLVGTLELFTTLYG